MQATRRPGAPRRSGFPIGVVVLGSAWLLGCEAAVRGARRGELVRWLAAAPRPLVALCAALAAALAVALWRLSAAARARRAAEEELRIANQLGEIFHRFPGPEMYGEVLRAVLDVMRSPRGTFAYLDERGALVAPSGAGAHDAALGEADAVVLPREEWEGTLWGRALEQARAQLSNRPIRCTRDDVTLARALAVPILHAARAVGLVMVAERATPYRERDRHRLERIARAISPTLVARLERDRNERERRAAEEALRERERELVEAQRVGRLGSWSWDARTDRIAWSQEYYRLYGLDPSRPPPGYEEHLRLYTQESAARLDTAVQRSLATGEPYVVDLELAGTDPPVRWITARAEVRRDASGAVVGLRGTAQDITERRRAEEALRRSEEQYRRIVETTHEGVWMVDGHGATTFVNRQMAEMLGFTADEMRGATFLDFMDEEGRRLATEALQRRFGGIPGQHELRFRRKDGTALWALVDVTPVRGEGGVYRGALAMLEDVTERRAVEEQLRQVQKLEAVGRLAGGVAHDFNNLLTAILGEVQLLVDGLAAADPLRVEALQIEAAARKAALLTRQLLTFGRKQATRPRVVDLAEIVTASDRMLRRLIGEDIELITVTDPGLGKIRIDAVQLEQVIVNLAVNARDAMPRGGRLTLECTNVEVEGAGARRRLGLDPGRYVLLAVHDTGTGMSPDVQAHLFEPFFTTKEPGKGTGLGLSTVYGIVKQAGGEVRVETAPERGTSFEIYLPRVDAAPDAVEPQRTGAAPRGTETVLVVEDDAMVRSLTAKALRRAGYEVLEAADPDHALELAAAAGERVALLLTDLVLPRLSGPELADRLRAARPGLAVLFASGYTDRAGDVEARLGARTGFLPKPFVPVELAQLVRALLDAAGDGGEVRGGDAGRGRGAERS